MGEGTDNTKGMMLVGGATLFSAGLITLDNERRLGFSDARANKWLSLVVFLALAFTVVYAFVEGLA